MLPKKKTDSSFETIGFINVEIFLIISMISMHLMHIDLQGQ
jgi:hypothetical protein